VRTEPHCVPEGRLIIAPDEARRGPIAATQSGEHVAKESFRPVGAVRTQPALFAQELRKDRARFSTPTPYFSTHNAVESNALRVAFAHRRNKKHAQKTAFKLCSLNEPIPNQSPSPLLSAEKPRAHVVQLRNFPRATPVPLCLGRSSIFASRSV